MKAAILVANYFEQAEFVQPRDALQAAGVEVSVISPVEGELTGMNSDVNKADTFTRDLALREANADEFDVLVVPGGTVNSDTLRQDKDAQAFVTSMLANGKPVAVICHGPWLLVSADLVRGRRLTSFPSLAVDIRNAGGEWVDEEVVVNDNLITSRNPDDLPAFTEALVAKVRT